MLRRTRTLEDFEARLRREPADYERNFRIFDLLWDEARELGVVGRIPTLAGLDRDIRYAAAVNRLGADRRDRR